ncbi:hypothetical protein PRZ48_014013 [Zasmidium cellare]|uniref:Uncharacterized protein n=1 Tax=Zasmidium cellare TaxID=395010 RepID=A0ABR0DZT8_ZASCE|nr:hypothetical protein PRZ48_014013 [Zasmidium cellare]
MSAKRFDLQTLHELRENHANAAAALIYPTDHSPVVPANPTPGAVNPRFFDLYYSPSESATTAGTGNNSQAKAQPGANETFRAMLTSANLMSTLLANNSSFGASISSISSPERVSLTETISNGLATLLDEG